MFNPLLAASSSIGGIDPEALSDLACSDVIHNATLWNDNADLRCQLVNATEACLFNDGHIEYIYGMYCVFRNFVPFGVTLMFLWLVLMLIGLATTADAFFGPCLIVMADTLHLSQNVAGVTLLALGNGAPDIFSAISSITTLKDGDAGLAFGALLGAGMFVTSVTAGAIAFVKPFTAMSRPLLKDIVFYMFTIFWAFIIMFKQSITLFDSIGFIVLYAVYVLITVLSRAVYAKGIGTGSKTQQSQQAGSGGDAAEAEAQGNAEGTSIPMDTIRRLRTDTDIRSNLTDVYADNPAFARDAPGSAARSKISSGAAPSGANSDPNREDQQRHHQTGSDAEAGYDTSLDFPGGLQRVGEGGNEVKKPRSRRFQELDIHSSPKTSGARKPSHAAGNSHKLSTSLDERMKRVSRVQKISRANSNTGSPKLSTAVAPSGSEEGVVSGGRKRSDQRKTSTASFTGVERRANYLTRWMLVYGDLEKVEHRSRSVSQSSYPEAAGASGGDGGGDDGGGGDGGRGGGSRGNGSRSSSVTKQPQQQQQHRESRTSQKVSVTVTAPPALSGQGLSRSGSYKVSGGLGMDGASSYLERKEQEKQSRKQQQQLQSSLQQRLQQELEQEEEDIQQRHLYRIESVDEALDDDTVDHLNRINQQRMAEQKRLEREEAARKDEERQHRQGGGNGGGEGEREGEEPEENLSPIKEFLYSLVPIDLEEFPEMTWYNKVYELVKAPLLFLLLLSTPCVDYDQPLNGWSRILNSLHCAVAPVFIGLAFKGYAWSIPMSGGASFPVLPILLLFGLILGLLVYFTSTDFEPPRYHAAFAFVGFLTALVWIYTFANEVVNILESIGIIFRISSTILGLTVLAWANSIGDVISNTVLARQNFPRIAISACFGGPLFNLLLGVGIPFTIKLISTEGATMPIQVTVVQLVLVVSVTVSLVLSMIYLTVLRYKLGRPYGLIMCALYVAFLVIALLAETGQLPQLQG